MQTFLPRHEVLQAALHADPGRLVDPERARRQLLGLPPFMALAALSGAGSDAVAEALRGRDGIQVGGGAGRWSVKAPTWERLGEAVIATPRPKGSRIRVEVDPPRQ